MQFPLVLLGPHFFRISSFCLLHTSVSFLILLFLWGSKNGKTVCVCVRDREGATVRQKKREGQVVNGWGKGSYRFHLQQASLPCICQSMSCCQWQCGREFKSISISFLCLFPHSLQEQLNTLACLSLLWPHCLQTQAQCRQEKSIIASLSVTIYLSHHLTLSLISTSHASTPMCTHC